MHKLNKTQLQQYNNTRRFVRSLNYEQIDLLVAALNENNCLQVTQTQIDAACDENNCLQVTQTQIDAACDANDERIIAAQLREEVRNASK